MAVSNAVVEKREQFKAKQKELYDVFELARDGDKYDFGRKSVMEKLGATDRADALEKVKAWNREVDEISADLEQFEAREIEESVKQRDEARSRPVRGGGTIHSIDEALQAKSFGELFTASPEYRESFLKGRQTGVPAVIDISIKTLFERGAGFAPESTRSGVIVPKADHSLAEITDLIPVFGLNQSAFVFMEETTRVHGAAEVAEGGSYGESEFVYEERTSPAKKIGDSIPVTDEQLEDEGSVASMLDQRLRYGCRKRLAYQILNGNGVGANLRGFLNTPNVQAQAKGSDNVFAAAYRALTKVRVTGDAEPSAFIFHPNDWQDGVVLMQDITGPFIWGHPAMVPVTRLWGLPVALSTGITENTALTGDFANFSRLDERRGIEVQIGFVANQFKEGKRTLRADLRTAFSVTRPSAFCTITGI